MPYVGAPFPDPKISEQSLFLTCHAINEPLISLLS